jgi:hypothetical protein
VIEKLEPITKDDWVQWKHNPVTKRVVAFAKMAKVEKMEELVRTAGINPQNDFYIRGFIAGLDAWLDIDIVEDTDD